MKKITLALSVITTLFAANTALAVDFLSAEEVKTAFSGKTTEGKHASKNKTSSSYLAPNGKLSGTGGKGTWHVDSDGKLCVKKGSKENCRNIAKDGDNYKKYKGNKHVWTYTSLVEGNPKNFVID
ncbi:MAG: hypothetical protein HKP55_06625 [Gammaproteobacteria bacterium]|nr:hypothetical protein [Gammaproteobacteria bacterium]